MLEKKDYVSGTIIIYVFLIMLFLLLQEKHKIENPCDYNQPCVRFCCADSGACKEKYIRESFNESLLHRYTFDEETNETSEFFILNGKPKCSMIQIPANDTSHIWRFIYVSQQFPLVNSKFKLSDQIVLLLAWKYST